MSAYTGPHGDVDRLDPAWLGLVAAGEIPPDHPARRNPGWRRRRPSLGERLDALAAGLLDLEEAHRAAAEHAADLRRDLLLMAAEVRGGRS